MLKYVESAVVLSEFPDQISLALNLSLCPNRCEGCSESYLAEDIGEELTEELLDKLINSHAGVTLIGFMGGDNDHESVIRLTNYIHQKYNLLVGMYSGRDFIDLELAKVLDYYKIGHYDEERGPLNSPTTNQKFLKKDINNW